MKLVHLSDLHLGKRVYELSMLEDQKAILKQILEIIREEAPDAVLLAGDIYDKTIPSAEAVQLFDQFLVSLAALHTQICVISGNHDSAERLAFGGRLMALGGVHLSPVYCGSVEPVVLEDHDGPVNIYLLPFIKPQHVRHCFPELEIESYTDAMKAAIDAMAPDPTARNVLITHQFVVGAQRCDSEEMSVGGTDAVDVSVFTPFDYVALGHLHGPQWVSRETVRYCGSPLKYSFSEADHKKSVTIVELGEKGHVEIRTRPLTPVRDLVRLYGSFAQLTDERFYQNTSYQEDYVHITLIDEEDIPDAVLELRKIYHNLMQLCYDNTRTRERQSLLGLQTQIQQDPFSLLEEFYTIQNNQPMNTAQREYARQLMDEIWEGKK